MTHREDMKAYKKSDMKGSFTQINTIRPEQDRYLQRSVFHQAAVQDDMDVHRKAEQTSSSTMTRS
jgi:hypothetical protein